MTIIDTKISGSTQSVRNTNYQTGFDSAAQFIKQEKSGGVQAKETFFNAFDNSKSGKFEEIMQTQIANSKKINNKGIKGLIENNKNAVKIGEKIVEYETNKQFALLVGEKIMKISTEFIGLLKMQ